jgi:hypothetical protein
MAQKQDALFDLWELEKAVGRPASGRLATREHARARISEARALLARSAERAEADEARRAPAAA